MRRKNFFVQKILITQTGKTGATTTATVAKTGTSSAVKTGNMSDTGGYMAASLVALLAAGGSDKEDEGSRQVMLMQDKAFQ